MPRKPGIFKQHQGLILDLIEQGHGYSEVTKILDEKYGIRTSKQNLKQSHDRHLKSAPSEESKKEVGVEQKAASKAPHLKNSIGSKKAPTKRRLESARRELVSIKLELQSLLDSEEASGRLSATEIILLRSWAEGLFSLHSQTAKKTFNQCYQSGFKQYEKSFADTLNQIEKEALYDELETRPISPKDQAFYGKFLVDLAAQNEQKKQQLMKGFQSQI